ncbi:2196_t:CDS:2 [Funneliformis geosporum]|uniref:2196_t:CDS:1 n=1 Tax=Funneliformis geosporum TaxID=1117311 RepID=A0A9W4SV48_9GLOM|nr:2196_t:CDS:2 [Funneliformis geosporum]
MLTPDRILIGISGKITMPLSRINTFKHKIYTEEELPISQRAYCKSQAENEIIKKKINNKLEKGFIRLSNNP